jgi:hypothetical protein
MVPFGHNTEEVPVVQYIHGDIKNIDVFPQLRSPITLPEYGQHLHAVQKKSKNPVIKDIGPGQENNVLRRRIQQDKSVHQGILVIGGKNDRFIAGNVLPSMVLHLTIKLKEE